MSAACDAQGWLVGVTIREVGRLSGVPDAAAALTVDLAGAGAIDNAAGAASNAPSTTSIPRRTAAPRWPAAASAQPTTPPPTPAEPAGPLTWEPEAEAAMARVPFFSRGRRRLAVVERARSRRLATITVALVEELAGRS